MTMKNSTIKTALFTLLAVALNPTAGFAQQKRKASTTDKLAKLDPGHYDNTWWNRTPIRLIQTNLPEIDARMDRDAFVRSIIDASGNVVLINTGGIVANY